MAHAAEGASTLADLLPTPRVAPIVRDALLVLAGVALTALAAQVSFTVPWTSVPYTLQTGAVLLTGTALGARRGAASMALYVLVGAIGLPVFAGGRSGLGGAEGGITPTLGYLIGFIIAGAMVGRMAERGWDRYPGGAAGLMVLGNLVIYLIGVPILALTFPMSLGDALFSGAVVFIPWDLAKIAIAALALPFAWRVAGDERRH
jgi:biotin transport system substrate-specific component